MIAGDGILRGLAGLAAILFFCGRAWPQAEPDADNPAPFGPPIEDEHVWFHAVFDELEGRLGSGNSFRWDGEAWTGTDEDRLWIKTEGKLEDGRVSDGQQEIYYDAPLSTYFDAQAGFRYDLDDRPGRGWLALGIEGLSPLFFHVATTLYVSDRGHVAAKLFGSYDLLITQRLILQPEIELNFYTKSDPKRLTGSGLSDLDTGLRLRYEISRKFAPYIGITREETFGPAEGFVSAAGAKTHALRLALGVRSWF